jgi:hypothetical protein
MEETLRLTDCGTCATITAYSPLSLASESPRNPSERKLRQTLRFAFSNESEQAIALNPNYTVESTHVFSNRGQWLLLRA